MYVYLFTYLFSVILNWVCWVRGNFSGGPGHIYSVCVTPLCGVPGRYNFIWRFHGADGGTVQIFLFSWLCSGYGTVEMVRGVARFFFCFLQFPVSSLGGWMSAVGIFCVIYFDFLW